MAALTIERMASDRPPKWAPTPKMFSALRGHASSINALAYRWDPSASSSRHVLFSGSGDETIRVWDLEERKCVLEMEKAHTGYVSSLLCVDDYLISGSFDRTICLWNVHRRTLIKSIKAHAHCVNSLFLHDSGVVLSGSWDAHIRLWDLRGKASDKGYVQILKVPDAALCVVGKDNDVFCGLHDSSIVSLDLRTGAHRDTFTGHKSYVTALHQANLELFSASADGSVRVTDIRNGNSRTVLDTGLSCFSVHHRVEGPARWVMSGHSDGTVRLTNVITGVVVQEYPSASEGQVFALVADATGLLLAGHKDGSIKCRGKLPAPEPSPAQLRELAQQRAAMALVVQRVFRGHGGRRQYRAHRKRMAAQNLQRVWRGHRGRDSARSQRRVQPPVLAPVGKGPAAQAASVSISCATPGAEIYYTWEWVREQGEGEGGGQGGAEGGRGGGDPVVGSISLGTRGVAYTKPLVLWGAGGLGGVDVVKAGGRGIRIYARAFHLVDAMAASRVVPSLVYRHAEEPRKLEKAESKRIGGGFKPTTGVSKELLKAMGARSARAVEAGDSAAGCGGAGGGGGGGSSGSSGAAKAKGSLSLISSLVAAKTAGKKLSASIPRKSASPAGGTGAAKDKDGGGSSGSARGILACSVKPAAKVSGSMDGSASNTHSLTRVSSNSSRSSFRTKDVRAGAASSASSADGGATRSNSSSGAEAPGEGPGSGGGKASVQAERADAPATAPDS